MSGNTTPLGTLSKTSSYLQGRLTRVIALDQPAMWAMLTTPERMAQWLAPGSIEQKQGGAVKLNFADSGTVIDSSVSAIDAPHLLEFSWSSPGQPTRPVRWELAAESGGTRATLTVSVPHTENIAATCAGWEAHLQMLQAAISGAPIKFPFETFKAAREGYRALAAALA